MEITVNGKPRHLESPTTIIGLLELLGINPKTVVVERNLNIVPRDAMESEPVAEGDSIEIVRLVGGG
ncbi:MAG TPA: sulfur carrier protein ThiS [Syntrophobacteraceae bacterium]|nr:sulfur carrier protein ThiS [Syntrophobacteraceae bacterium]